MKKILLLIIVLTIFSCSEKKKETNSNLLEKTNKTEIKETKYTDLLEKVMNNEEVDKFLKKLGSEYEFDDSYGPKFYTYNSKGVELNFNKSDTLKAIFFTVSKLSSEIKLPLNIKPTDTRKDIIEKFGEPDKYFTGLNNLNAYYLENDLVIKFKSKDTSNLNNGIENISIQKLDRKKILGTK